MDKNIEDAMETGFIYGLYSSCCQQHKGQKLAWHRDTFMLQAKEKDVQCFSQYGCGNYQLYYGPSPL